MLALAGGVPQSTQDIYVIRQLEISDTVLPSWNKDNAVKNIGETLQGTLKQSPSTSSVTPTPKTNTNIEDLIQQLNVGEDTAVPQKEVVSPTENSNASIDDLINQLDIGDNTVGTKHNVSPGIIQTGAPELIDIDDLVPSRRTGAQAYQRPKLPVDVDELIAPVSSAPTGTAFIYVSESDSWEPVSVDPKRTRDDSKVATQRSASDEPVVLERIIKIPWGLLEQGDSSYNIVIRRSGKKITLSEFITSAGDLGPIAVPEKISLTRRFGDVQATVTLNYAAILQRTEPDIFLKPNDHISIGTNWGATPMAIIGNGFRATYGFGFLLDRNFGTDVFGRPP